MPVFIHQQKEWPHFFWDETLIALQLADVRHRQMRVLTRMDGLGGHIQTEANIRTLTQALLLSGETQDGLRFSLAQRLSLSNYRVDGAVGVMLDATQQYSAPLTEARLSGWHDLYRQLQPMEEQLMPKTGAVRSSHQQTAHGQRSASVQ